MFVTVAICTWNRASLLGQTLTQLCSLRVPDGVEWELLVVNNNSTDTTEAVVRSFADRLPIQHLMERKQGQSHARNHAIDVAKGELLLWTDDDVLVDPGWLSAYVDAVRRWPDAGYFGGLIVPWFEHEPPQWLRDNAKALGGMLVARDLGPDERPLETGEEPYGANMGFRTSAIAGRRFDPNLGLSGDNAIRYDESEFCRSLRSSGVQGVWVPSASVQHFVVSGRMTLDYVRSYYEGSGRTIVRIEGPSAGRLILGAPQWLYRDYFAARAAYLWRRIRRHPGWLLSYLKAAQARGAILENRLKRSSAVTR